MTDLSTDVVVVGAGVVGLAVARRFALAGLQVVLVERQETFGTEASSRNSEVIHAGLYYPAKSLKAQLCVRGRELLYEYCRERAIPHRQLGKLVVATDSNEAVRLERIHHQAKENGCEEVYLLGGQEFARERAELNAQSILLSPRTGIIDSHQLMLNLLGDFERYGGLVAWKTEVAALCSNTEGASVLLADQTEVRASCIINAAGLGAPALLPDSASRFGLRLAKGDYFAYAASVPFERLVYPVPPEGGLGVHLTLDLSGRARFGPDLTWVDQISYEVDGSKVDQFYDAVSRYWPACDRAHFAPSYSGIRPKVTFDGELVGDFRIVAEAESTVSTTVHLLGIESPGLTSCLALADYIFEEVA